jgi:hypothetical protein
MRNWLLVSLAVGTGAAAAMALQNRPVATAKAPTMVPATHPAALFAAGHDIAAAPAAVVPDAGVAAAAPVGTSVERSAARIERDAQGLWHLELHAYDRADAAARLAALSGTQLFERPQALAQARRATLRWQGRELAEAWRVLLADDAHYALDCRGAQACRIWVFGAHSATNAAASAPATPAATVLPTPPIAAELPTGQTAPTAPLQPDPPGLFPSD